MVAQDEFNGFRLQKLPPIFAASLPGNWLITRSTPSWRIDDPVSGFQRMVDERRARKIAATVLDQNRTFPNAIVLATDSADISIQDCTLTIPSQIKFLVVDGQHRLWAQRFSSFEASYACVIHVGLDERKMAELFLEINDNQKRVPSSLRWDLVRLVQPEDDPAGLRATDIIYDLSTERESPLFQRVDLTGEQPQISLKQGSLAPDLKRLVGGKAAALKDIGYEAQVQFFKSFFVAVRDRDPDGWESANGPLYKARILRALLVLLPEMVRRIGKGPEIIAPDDFGPLLGNIDLDTLSGEQIRAQQGSAGIAAISKTLKTQIFR